MKLWVARFFLGLSILLGAAAFGLSIWGHPTLNSVLISFEGSYLSNIRRAASVSVLGLVSLLILLQIGLLVLSFLKSNWFVGIIHKAQILVQQKIWFYILGTFFILGTLIAGQFSIPAEWRRYISRGWTGRTDSKSSLL